MIRSVRRGFLLASIFLLTRYRRRSLKDVGTCDFFPSNKHVDQGGWLLWMVIGFVPGMLSGAFVGREDR